MATVSEDATWGFHDIATVQTLAKIENSDTKAGLCLFITIVYFIVYFIVYLLCIIVNNILFACTFMY